MVQERPTTKQELWDIIDEEIVSQGNDADLSLIDTSLISDMSDLFRYSDSGT